MKYYIDTDYMIPGYILVRWDKNYKTWLSNYALDYFLFARTTSVTLYTGF